MSASKNRPRWHELPGAVRGRIEVLAGGRVVAAENCAGGYSPGFASRLTLAGGRRVFAKAIDGAEWPSQTPFYRDEIRVARVLPSGVIGPEFLGSADDGRWVMLTFACVDGTEPAWPWRAAELAQVAAAIGAMSQVLTPSPVALPAGQPRIGGWPDIAADPVAVARLRSVSGWAAANLGLLTELEQAGLEAARGQTLVHFDALPHNILRTEDQVWLVDWPHARLGAPFVDLLMVLASAGTAAGGSIDLDGLLVRQPVAAGVRPDAIDAVLTALTGFYLAGALADVPAGLGPVAAAKRELGRSALHWLRQRLTSTESSRPNC